MRGDLSQTDNPENHPSRITAEHQSGQQHESGRTSVVEDIFDVAADIGGDAQKKEETSRRRESRQCLPGGNRGGKNVVRFADAICNITLKTRSARSV